MADDKMIKIGAGWKKTSKAGNNYLSIKLDAAAIGQLNLAEMNVMIFAVKEKKNPNSPDYSVSASYPMQRQVVTQPQRPAAQQQRPQQYAPQQSNAKALGFDDSDDF